MNRIKSSELDFSLSGFDVPQHRRPYNEHRLLVYHTPENRIEHIMFQDIARVLKKDDLLVFNNSKVVPVSVFLDSDTFILFMEPFKNDLTDVRVICPFKPKVGETFHIGGACLELMSHEPGWDVYHADIKAEEKEYKDLEEFLDKNAKMPMPIYLKRIPDDEDVAAFQNFYAEIPGSIAAPVAGLHFNKELVDNLKELGVRTATVTLHVGYGTFRSFKTEYVDEHKMDAEYYQVQASVFEEVKRAKEKGGRIIGVGTTSVRVLESLAAREDFNMLLDSPREVQDQTQIFIYPSYQFKVTEGLITNFQYPRLPVLAMAAAMTGLDNLRHVYDESLKENYKYYSFGDAMLLLTR